MADRARIDTDHLLPVAIHESETLNVKITEAIPTIPKTPIWEYKKLSLNDNFTWDELLGHLVTFGADGWEFVEILRLFRGHTGGNPEVGALLKRIKP